MTEQTQATNETIEAARSLRDLVAKSAMGLHRHQILQQLGMGKNRYSSIVRFGVRMGWVRVDGMGTAARVVAIPYEE